jgi:hypothetical protein
MTGLALTSEFLHLDHDLLEDHLIVFSVPTVRCVGWCTHEACSLADEQLPAAQLSNTPKAHSCTYVHTDAGIFILTDARASFLDSSSPPARALPSPLDRCI